MVRSKLFFWLTESFLFCVLCLCAAGLFLPKFRSGDIMKSMYHIMFLPLLVLLMSCGGSGEDTEGLGDTQPPDGLADFLS